MGTGHLQEWVQGIYRSGYRETTGVGTGRLQEWVQGDYRSGYRETTGVGTGRACSLVSFRLLLSLHNFLVFSLYSRHISILTQSFLPH